MLVNNFYIVSSVNLLVNHNCYLFQPIVEENQFYIYSFTEKIELMQLMLSEKTNLVCSKYLDRFLICEPITDIQRRNLWRRFFEYFSSAYEDIIDKDRNMSNISNLYKILQENFSLTSKSKLLDFACGTGLSVNVISDVKLTGTDSSNNMLKIANQNGLDVIKLSTLKRQKYYYDAIFVSYSLHLCYDVETLSLMWQVLKNDAALAANFHKRKGVNEVIDFVSSKHGKIKQIKNISDRRHGDYYVFIKK